jgi:hypothetical protein
MSMRSSSHENGTVLESIRLTWLVVLRTPVKGTVRVRVWREYPKGARRGMSDFL